MLFENAMTAKRAQHGGTVAERGTYLDSIVAAATCDEQETNV